MKLHRLAPLVALAALLFPHATRAQDAPRPLFGALQNKPENIASNFRAGLRVAILELGWNRYEPRDDAFNEEYIEERRKRLAELRAGGMQVMLDLGMQYPPRWAHELPHARYVNQHGAAFEPGGIGHNGVNAVWSQRARDEQAEYVARIFQDLGTDFLLVRLGWGYYGELNFPTHRYAEKENCYWAYDDLAQGKATGLAAGLTACPVPGWKPGEGSENHTSARRFLDWYLGTLQNYHDWQIGTVRRHYAGPLAMLYPSWGIRPGQAEAAVANDLGGATSPEKNGEIQRGFDFERFIRGVHDPKLVAYCTWVDSDPQWSDEASADRARWSPPHFLSTLAREHPLKLKAWGENTGGGGVPAMERSFQRLREFDLDGLMWAFEPDLYDGEPPTIDDYARLIASVS